MWRWPALAALILFPPARLTVSPATVARSADKAPSDVPVYNADGGLRIPADYREWIYLSSGLDMSYDKKPIATEHSTFDNVFVNPTAYARFRQTGTWPDGTMLVLELRGAQRNASINTRGRTQSIEQTGLEVHLKDSTHLPGGWGFFSFDKTATGKLIPATADCYTCHQQHAAVDTTFVQFYPTLLPIAQRKHTLSANYLKETAGKP